MVKGTEKFDNGKESGLTARIIDKGELFNLKLGDSVYDEGVELEHAYMLLSGKIRLFHLQADQEVVERTVCMIEEANDWIGLDAICLNGKTLTSARSSADSKLLKISKPALLEIYSTNPEFENKLKTKAIHIRQLSESANEAVPATVSSNQAENKSADTFKSVKSESKIEEDNHDSIRKLVRKKFKLYPFILQQSAMDCGIACLAMVMEHYGSNVSLRRLRELVGVSSQGTDLTSMSEASEKLGFMTRGLRASYEGLLRARLPLICHWDNNHFVVLYEIDKTSALIGDPANDLTTITREDFSSHFSMYALELVPSPSLAKSENEALPLLRYAKLLTPYRKNLFDIVTASLAVQLLTLAVPLFTQLVVDRVLVHKSISMLNMLLSAVLILILFQTLISSIRSYLVAFTAVKLDQSLFTRFFKHLLNLPLSFFEEHTTGDIISRLQENRKIQNFISGSALTTGVDLVMALFYLILVFAYNWLFGFYVIFYVAVFTIILTVVTPWLRTLMLKVFQKQVASTALTIEAVRGIERIKSASAENRMRWAWEELFIDALNTRYRGTLVSRFTQVAAEFVNLTGGILLLWFGAQLVVQDKITIGQLMALTMIVSRITQPVLYLVDMWDEIQDLGVSFERISEVLDTEPEEIDAEGKLSIKLEGNVEFSDVTFRYPSNKSVNALQNLSFSVKAGETIGIVGRSGCGKTTLLKLLQGLYLPSEGRVLIDGHDIKHLSLRDLRRQFGVVSQQDYLFRGTIFDTIAFYNPQASNNEVIEAARLAGIHEFINSLPKSYQYEVAEGGINLSGGQRQRLCIARALLHNPSVLLFDEASSFLDYDSERALQESLQKLRHGRTLFIVAHRLSTIRDADRILVIDHGEVVESGPHDELLALKGLYYQLWSQANVV